jgi:DNA-binding MarR family transcriptional regulator
MSDLNGFPKNPYAGGRFLKAISANKNLKSNEKLVMLTLGGELDYKDFEHSQRYISIAQFSELTSLSRDTVFRVIGNLCQNGYIVRENRFDENNRQQSNLYSLTPKIFTEFLYANSAEGSRIRRGGVAESDTNLLQKELPQEEKTIPKGIVQKIENPISEVLETEIPKKEKKPKKTTNADLKKTVGYLSAMFKPDGSPETRGFPWPNREQITVVAETLIEQFHVKDIQEWFNYFSQSGQLGKMRWIPSKFANAIFEFHKQKNV